MKSTGRPLILTAETERLPRRVLVRDTILTMLLWAGCGAMWLQLFPEIRDWFAARAREDLHYELPSVVQLLRQGLVFTAGLMVAYFFWSYRTWRGANRDLLRPLPAALDPQEEAAAYGLPPEQAGEIRAQASVTILTARDGRIESWSPGPRSTERS
ncbi:hypothetical protein Verru16b_00685 [Lacunisphaera limnophila]|uniref:Poly-beta-1,6-N-acetyl-D-glucosamine biosynthesis protein PgaD n=1 Tax=Lacunisphaera limnophila TaxID=1838286 RepID=A0A1D8ARV9_9BACT|nr:PgaD family protein [Lacunisphaera limnophila]AOS43633.1 hypothetical protein Verru16b_00685 [Lacunisphaera limnophila]